MRGSRRAAAAALAILAGATVARAQAPADALSPQTALEAALAESVRASCPKVRYQIDPTLTRAAAEFARAVAEGRASASGSALGFYASLESAEPAPVAGVATIEPASTADRAVGDLYSRACRFNRAGVAAGRFKGGAVVALLTARHDTELSPLPKRVDRGAQLEVKGRLGKGLRHPRLFILRPDGKVEQRELAHRPGAPPLPENRFFARVGFDEPGEHNVEVLADGPGGPQVVALRRIFSGVDPPQRPPPEVSPAAGSGLEAVAAAISSLRAARGLPPLVRDAELDAVAHGHSRQMAYLRTFAHVLPTDGTLTDRLFKAGYGYRSAGENIGLADTAALAHEAVALSPAHLANLLDPRHRRVGLGAVEGTSPEGSPCVYLTEVLASPIVGLADPAGEVAKLILRQRLRRGLKPLVRDRRLDSVAEREVRTVALSDRKIVDDAAQRALDVARDLTSAVAELYVGTQADEVLHARNLDGPLWTRLGVGAMYATSQTYGPGRLWVVVVLAR